MMISTYNEGLQPARARVRPLSVCMPRLHNCINGHRSVRKPLLGLLILVHDDVRAARERSGACGGVSSPSSHC